MPSKVGVQNVRRVGFPAKRLGVLLVGPDFVHRQRLRVRRQIRVRRCAVAARSQHSTEGVRKLMVQTTATVGAIMVEFYVKTSYE